MKNTAKQILAGTILASSMALGSTAMAGPTDATIDLGFPGGSGLFPVGSVVTTISYDNGEGTSSRSRVRAGMFGGTASNGVNFDLSTLYRSADDVLAYCVDILNNLLLGSSTYNVNTLGQTQVVEHDGVRRDFGRTLRFLGAVNQVSGLAFGQKNWLNPSEAWMSAAIQVGIWESLYEQEGEVLSVNNGWFAATSLGTQGNAFLSSAFDAMGTADAVRAPQVRWLQIDGGQDLIVDPVAVSAPASLMLVSMGLFGLSRRRKA